MEPPGNLIGGFKWTKIKRTMNRVRRFAVKTHILSITVRERRGPEEKLAALPKETEKGTTWEFIVGGGGGNTFPFQVLDISDEEGAKVRVRVGSITDFFGAYLPTGMVDGDDPPFYLSVADNDYVYVKVTAEITLSLGTYGQIISCDVLAGASVPASDFSAGLFYQQLAFVRVNAGPPPSVSPITQTAGGSFGWELSGGTGRFWSLGPP